MPGFSTTWLAGLLLTIGFIEAFVSRLSSLPIVLHSSATNNNNNNDDVIRRTMDDALAKMVAISEPTFAAGFNKRRAKMVEVKQSSIPGAGLGLFAKEQIKSGTLVSFMPCHTLGIDLGESIRRVSLLDHNNTAGSQTTTQTYEHTEGKGEEVYLLNILGSRPLMKKDISSDLGGESIFLDVDSRQTESIGFDGHRVNDGATVFENNEDGCLVYYRSSRKAKNCVHVPFGPSPLIATVTTRKIKKGDEFFTTYGCSYWLESLLMETGEAEETDMTESIISEAKQAAVDILKGMKGLEVTHGTEADELQAVFDAP